MSLSPLILRRVLNAFDLCSDQSRGSIKGKSFNAHIDNRLPFFPLFFGLYPRRAGFHFPDEFFPGRVVGGGEGHEAQAGVTVAMGGWIEKLPLLTRQYTCYGAKRPED